MTKVKAGDTVKVNYTVKLDDGTQVDTSAGRGPLEFKIGYQKVIAGVEEAVIGMQKGESKKFAVPADKGYGPYREELIIKAERSQLPPDLKFDVGDHLEMEREGQFVVVTVTEISEESVTLDGNHPLAGKDLTFEIELLEIA
jgi:peptidylprolyl isomerase